LRTDVYWLDCNTYGLPGTYAGRVGRSYEVEDASIEISFGMRICEDTLLIGNCLRWVNIHAETPQFHVAASMPQLGPGGSYYEVPFLGPVE
jgi:hypothetical protein